MLEYVVLLMGAFGFSAFCAMNRHTKSFSFNIFISAFTIALLILMWIEALPMYTIVFVALTTIILIIKPSSEGAADE